MGCVLKYCVNVAKSRRSGVGSVYVIIKMGSFDMLSNLLFLQEEQQALLGR
jgi:hypothetical protein